MRIVAPLFIAMFAGLVFGQTGLTGITWRVEMLNGTPVGTMTYTIKFTANDSAASGKIDCNTCGWRYKTSGQSITITGGFCTDMACMGESRGGEYEAALTSATKYAVSNSRLYLIKDSDTLAKFIDESMLINALTGTTWRLEKLNQSSMGVYPVRLGFSNDSTAWNFMVCNNAVFNCSITPTTVFFTFYGRTVLHCGDSAMSFERLYMTTLETVRSWKIMGNHLFFLNDAETILEYVDTAAVGVENGNVAAKPSAQAFALMVKENAIFVTVSGEDAKRVRLLDMRGKCVSQSSRSANQYFILNTATLPAGMYLLEVTGRSGLSGKRLITIIR